MFLTEISHADRSIINMKHIKRDLIFDWRPVSHPPDPGIGVKRSNSTFSEHSHVAYQIKVNHECSSIVANILLADPYPPTWPCGWGQMVKIQLFQNMVMLHIKLTGITKCSNMVANILPSDPLPPTTLGMGSKGQKSTFSEHGFSCISN